MHWWVLFILAVFFLVCSATYAGYTDPDCVGSGGGGGGGYLVKLVLVTGCGTIYMNT